MHAKTGWTIILCSSSVERHKRPAQDVCNTANLLGYNSIYHNQRPSRKSSSFSIYITRQVRLATFELRLVYLL